MNISQDFEKIYYLHAQKVYRLCLGYALGNEELAKEWQQETFIKVWQHRQAFKGKSSIGTWIYRIAVNTCLSDLRKIKKLEEINDNLLATLTEEQKDDREAQIKKMYHCINQLPPNNKTIILLALEEVPQAEIAEMQGMKHGALRTRLNRIRQALLKCISNEK